MINYETGNDFDAAFIESELELFNTHSKRSPQDEEYKKFIIVVKKINKLLVEELPTLHYILIVKLS